MKRQKTKYSEKFKKKVVEEVLNKKYSKEEANRIYGIKSNSAILYWIRKYSGIKNYRQPSEFEMKSNKQNEILENEKTKRIEELESELAKESLRAELWKKMIEIAEEELGVEIRKKFGAEQLLKLKKKAENR